MTNLEIYNSADSSTIQLSDAGKKELEYIVKKYGNFEWIGDESQLDSLSVNDIGFDDDGYINLELSGLETKSGVPTTYQLDIEEHFVVKDDEGVGA